MAKRYPINLRLRNCLPNLVSLVQPLSAAGLQVARSVHEGPAAESVNIAISVYMPGGLIQELLRARRHDVKSALLAHWPALHVGLGPPSRNAFCVVFHIGFRLFRLSHKVGRKGLKSHSVWVFAIGFDKCSKRQFEFPIFLKRVGTPYAWLFPYVDDDFRI